ncbi:uncharacterized protein LOC115889468 isoform X2 [Sitophilus oryzae]|uniref:Uncharacterized protein LOC115889468 isoform X2 n=1 Tax=Sitophilus oryzae TaxID=7048 RepID=A0A6J2YRA6_SITOR|nr:uncharacterized protein LOC115889468 isoform X2 [Sitophilus oryzae]
MERKWKPRKKHTPEKQKLFLKQIFPDWLLIRVISELSMDGLKFGEDMELFENVEQEKKKAELDSSTRKRDTSKSTADSNDIKSMILEEALFKLRGTLENIFEPIAPPETTKSKMFMDFFKRKPSRAAIWRTLPPLELDEMNLNQKAEAITEKIATDFIEWLKDLGGDEELSLTVQSIIDMFEIGFYADIATSLKVHLRELASVPQKVAEARKLPHKAKRAVLHQEITNDLRASKKKTVYAAFGRRLPSELQTRPQAENYFKKWMSCDRVPENLSSMATVWQGITHLKSTRAYCEYLIERPDIKPPKYLLDCGMLNPKNLQDASINDSDYSVGGIFPDE